MYILSYLNSVPTITRYQLEPSLLPFSNALQWSSQVLCDNIAVPTITTAAISLVVHQRITTVKVAFSDISIVPTERN